MKIIPQQHKKLLRKAAGARTCGFFMETEDNMTLPIKGKKAKRKG